MVSQFRSALDDLANRLVEANGGTPTRATAFPVFKTIEGWKNRSGDKVAGMSAPHVALIKAKQPCFAKNEYQARFLGYLEDIWNADKHRNVTLVTAIASGQTLHAPFHLGNVDIFFHTGAVEKGRVICRVPGPDVDMDLAIIYDIAFGQGGTAAGVIVSQFYYMVDLVVPEIISSCGL